MARIVHHLRVRVVAVAHCFLFVKCISFHHSMNPIMHTAMQHTVDVDVAEQSLNHYCTKEDAPRSDRKCTI